MMSRLILLIGDIWCIAFHGLVKLKVSFAVLSLAICMVGVNAQEVRSAHSANCLDAWDGAGINAQIFAVTCNFGPNQHIYVSISEETGPTRGLREIVHRHSKLCLKPDGNFAGSPVRLQRCAASTIWRKSDFNQFELDRPGVQTRLCLDMSLSDGTADKRPVILWACKIGAHGSELNQHWSYR